MHKIVRINRDLIESSVEDAKLTLEDVLNHNPQMAKDAAKQALDYLPIPKRKGHMTRVAMLRTIIKRADKLLATSK
ncbi:hypothetical protein V8T50_03420 [Vibrio parahaemolyticus]|uniref:hypothetical protein n=1 Tax=Vibrio parahaemolyticus TaxID=670 RepID=UPI001785CDEA|nr:hypothetical protein [Vibrio parahaemolyticus]EHJ9983667.1 hypothetical protein [Vibrio parahaemolyticus]MBD6983500.1 hypothetical protein [Vibrio parahaemolyticus]MBD6986747.1 hypothetical protein [Vibrio parahaemolyticus]